MDKKQPTQPTHTHVSTWVPASRGVDLNIKITASTATAFQAQGKVKNGQS